MQNKADTAVLEAVIANVTESYGYGYLAPIMKNAIRTICDMRLRPEVYFNRARKLILDAAAN